MIFRKVWAAYFSATSTTKKIVTAVAGKVASELGLEYEEYDFTLPDARASELSFSGSDIVIFGTPVIAGRVPNVLLKYLSSVKGNGAAAVPVVLFGNRDFDDALIELRDILIKGGFRIAAGGAFVGEHSFSDILGKGRPDEKDMYEAAAFAVRVSKKIKDSGGDSDENCDGSGDGVLDEPVELDGTPYPYRGYYMPRDRKGEHIDIRKVIPVTHDNCTDCKLCAEICPMGSIDHDDVSKLNGICIKCCACVKSCPVGAKSFDDPGFIYHKEELEEMYRRRAENRTFY